MCLSNFVTDIDNDFDIKKKELFKGAYGTVSEGFRKADNLHVAIKTILDPLINEESKKNLMREFHILASLNHPKCLKLITFSLNPPRIVTPFMRHGTLNDLLNERNAEKDDFDRITPTQLMCTVYGMCSTMEFLHFKKIIHRDFKPLNIFLDENYDICLADFGLSRKVQENINLTKNNYGTPLYMAPEIFDESDYNNKVDVYSFGVSYLQYFSKLEDLDDMKGPIKQPFQLMMRIQAGARFVRPDGINDDQWAIYQECTSPNPNARPTFAELSDRFENNQNLWFEGVIKDEYLKYVQECKSYINRNDSLGLPPRLSMSASPGTLNSSLTFSTRQLLQNSNPGSRPASQRKKKMKHY